MSNESRIEYLQLRKKEMEIEMEAVKDRKWDGGLRYQVLRGHHRDTVDAISYLERRVVHEQK